MTIKLNDRGYQHGKGLIEEGKFVSDQREDWSEHHLSTPLEKEFVEERGFAEYAKWFLAVNDGYGKTPGHIMNSRMAISRTPIGAHFSRRKAGPTGTNTSRLKRQQQTCLP